MSAGELLPRQQYAMCRCGCGWPPPIASRTNRKINIYQGEPLVCIPGHQGKLGARKLSEAARAGLPDPNPSGRCWCQCGQPTNIAKKTDLDHGEYIGRHNRYRRGHQLRMDRYSSQMQARRRLKRQWMLAWFNQSAKVLEARPARLILEARPLAVRRQLALRQPQARVMCVGCFESRPLIAFIPGHQPCICCIARQRKQAVVDRRLITAEVEAKRRTIARAKKAQQASVQNGTARRGPNLTIKKRKTVDVPLRGSTPR